MSGRRRSWLKNLGLVLVSLVAAVAAAELGLRLFYPAPPLLYHYDPLLGSSLRPGAHGWWRREHRAYVQINSLGWRDRPRRVVKAPGVNRFILVGDSYIEALMVPLEETIGLVLEHRLGSAGRVEFLNAGLSGVGTAHEYLLLRHRLFKLSPDGVILFFFVGNDLTENSPAYNPPERPLIRLVQGRLEVDNTFRNRGFNRFRRSLAGRVLYWLIPRSHLLRWINYYKYDLVRLWRRLWSKSRPASGAAPEALNLKGNRLYLSTAPSSARERIWRLTERLLSEMARMCRQRKVKFGVVIIPVSMQVDRDLRQKWQRKNPKLEIDLPERRLLEICRRQKIPVLALSVGFERQTGDRAGKYYRYGPANDPHYGHWNASGHAAAADLVAAWLRRLGWLGSGGRGGRPRGARVSSIPTGWPAICPPWARN